MKQPPVVRTERLEIVDKDGRPGMVLSMVQGNPVLQMFDSQGQLRATLYIGKNAEPGLALGRNNKEVNLLIYVDQSGAPQIRLRQADFENHVVIHTAPAPSITLNDSLGQLVLRPPSQTE